MRPRGIAVMRSAAAFRPRSVRHMSHRGRPFVRLFVWWIWLTSAFVPGGRHTPKDARDRVGWFRYYFDDDRWEWSDEVFRIHGYQPGQVDVTTALVLSHKHTEDAGVVAALLEDIRASRRPLSSRHRMIDANGDEHVVVLVGDLLRDDVGTVVGTHGYYVVAGPAWAAAEQEIITEKVMQIAESRAHIERVKGMLMMIYGIEPEVAFELLKWRSQVTNVKLRAMVGQLTRDLTGLASESQLPSRSVVDELLRTVHERCE